jgi:hypothetical protein
VESIGGAALGRTVATTCRMAATLRMEEHRRTEVDEAAASHGTAMAMCRTAVALCGTLAGSVWRPINRLGQFGRTGARMGVWVVGLNCDGGGRGA